MGILAVFQLVIFGNNAYIVGPLRITMLDTNNQCRIRLEFVPQYLTAYNVASHPAVLDKLLKKSSLNL